MILSLRKMFVFAVILLTCQAQAGTEVGNGADGVIQNGRVYLVDLYEAGIHKNPYIDSHATVDKYVENEINKLFTNNLVPKKIVIQKLSEIAKHLPMVAYSIVVAMRHYKWEFTTEALPEIHHDYKSDRLGKNVPTVQVAVRYDNVIKVSIEHFSKMNEANKAATILHEGIYMLVLGGSAEVDENSDYENNIQSQKINAIFFTKGCFSDTNRAIKLIDYKLPGAALLDHYVTESKSGEYAMLRSDYQIYINNVYILTAKHGLNMSDAIERIVAVCEDARRKRNTDLQFQVRVYDWLFNLAQSEMFNEVDSFILWRGYSSETAWGRRTLNISNLGESCESRSYKEVLRDLNLVKLEALNR